MRNKICTDVLYGSVGSKEEGVNALSDTFNNKFNFKFRVVPKKVRGVIRYPIFVPKREAAHFIDVIKPTFLKFGCMQYKLGTHI